MQKRWLYQPLTWLESRFAVESSEIEKFES
jgi:hypothetical protein